MKTLKNNISEACKVHVHCLKYSDSDSYDKNGMKEKVNDLVRSHKAMQEELKTASYSGQIKFLHRYLINGLKCTGKNILMSLNILY